MAKYGDIVNYKTDSGDEISGVIVNKFNDVVEVMPVKENGKAITVGNVFLNGITGYNEGIDKINSAAVLNYPEPKASRALNYEDVIRITSENIISNTDVYEFTSGTFIVDELTKVNNSILAVSLDNINVGDTISVGDVIGEITIENIILSHDSLGFTRVKSISTYFDNSCWLASKTFLKLWDENNTVTFDMQKIYNPTGNYQLDSNCLFRSNGEGRSARYPVVPVFYFSSQVSMESGEEDGIWNVNY